MITTPRASVVIDDGNLRRDLENFFAQTQNPVALAKVLGRELANTIRAHLREKDKAEPNKLGGKRTHFWLQVSRSVQQPEMEQDGVSVGISDPRFAQRLFGGRITAKLAKALTIPVHPRAHGKRASVLEAEIGQKLFRFKSESGDTFLAVAERSESKAPGIKRTEARYTGKFWLAYLLRKSVDQQGDPTALPQDEKVADAMLTKANEWVDRKQREMKL